MEELVAVLMVVVIVGAIVYLGAINQFDSHRRWSIADRLEAGFSAYVDTTFSETLEVNRAERNRRAAVIATHDAKLASDSARLKVIDRRRNACCLKRLSNWLCGA